MKTQNLTCVGLIVVSLFCAAQEKPPIHKISDQFKERAENVMDSADLIDVNASEFTFKREYDEAKSQSWKLNRFAKGAEEAEASRKIGVYIDQFSSCRTFANQQNLPAILKNESCLKQAVKTRADALESIGDSERIKNPPQILQ